MVKKRRNFTMRLQPPEDSLLAEVLDYFQTLEREELNKSLTDLLIAAFLPLARFQKGTFSHEDLRVTCITSCDSLSRQAEYLRQVLGVNHPSTLHLILSSPLVTEGRLSVSPPTTGDSPDGQAASRDKSTTAGGASADLAFGGFDD
jgi:hypothetical protein